MICKTLIQNTARNDLFSKRSATVMVGCENRYADCGGELYFIFRDLGVIFNEIVWFSNLFFRANAKMAANITFSFLC